MARPRTRTATVHPLMAQFAARRRDLGLTLEQVAELTGLTFQYVSQLELGQHVPSVVMVERVLAAVGLQLVATEVE